MGLGSEGLVRPIAAVVGIACCLSLVALAPVHPTATVVPGLGGTTLRLVQTIPLRGVEGRIDHMAVDPLSGRLFVAALGNATVEVVDLHSAERVESLRGFHEPQGVGFLAKPPRLFVTNGGDGTCVILDGLSLRRLRTLRLSGDADNIRCDPSTERVYVGYGAGGLRVLDAATGNSLADITLSAHPESFQLENAGSRVFANVPEANAIAIVDRTQGRVIAEWKIEGLTANYPMALDEAGHRLFVGCRHPAAVAIFDLRSGRRAATMPIDGDVDDLFYEETTGQLFASCGTGFIDVLGEGTSGTVKNMARIPTAPGARTGLYVPALRRFYLGVPHHGRQTAEIRVFEVE